MIQDKNMNNHDLAFIHGRWSIVALPPRFCLFSVLACVSACLASLFFSAKDSQPQHNASRRFQSFGSFCSCLCSVTTRLGEDSSASTAQRNKPTMVDPDEEEEAVWRNDSSKCISDFTIKIRNKPTGDEDVYNVHKYCLMFGERKSGYFVGCLNDGGKFSEKSEVELELHDAAARAFPSLLDYVYTGKHEEPSPEEAVALLHLGNYFWIPDLVEKMKEFVFDQMSLETLTLNLPTIIDFKRDEGMESIYELAKHFVIESIFDRSPVLKDLVVGMDVTFTTEVCSRVLILFLVDPGLNGPRIAHRALLRQRSSHHIKNTSAGRSLRALLWKSACLRYHQKLLCNCWISNQNSLGQKVE